MASVSQLSLSVAGYIVQATNEAGAHFYSFLKTLEEKAEEKNRLNSEWRPATNIHFDAFGLMQKYSLVDENGIMSDEIAVAVFQKLGVKIEKTYREQRMGLKN